MKDKQVIESSQHAFVKEKSCLTKLSAFYNDMTNLMDERRAVHFFYLNFSEVF